MAYKYIYGTCRNLRVGSIDLGNQSLNGGYTAEFFNQQTFGDFADANITKLCLPVPEDKYIGVLPLLNDNEEVIGTVPKLTRFVRLRYSDLYTNSEDLTKSIQNAGSINNVVIFDTIEKTKQRLRDNTSLVELSEGVFEITPEYVDEISGETISQQTLVIE